MKIVKNASKIDDHQESGIYDPQEKYDENASRYTVNLPVNISSIQMNSSMLDSTINGKNFKKRFKSKSISGEHVSLSEGRNNLDIEPEFRQEVSKSSSLIVPRNLIEHQEIINALMLAIKPSLSDIFFKRFTKEMLK
jgi:hypothetical protein